MCRITSPHLNSEAIILFYFGLFAVRGKWGHLDFCNMFYLILSFIEMYFSCDFLFCLVIIELIHQVPRPSSLSSESEVWVCLICNYCSICFSFIWNNHLGSYSNFVHYLSPLLFSLYVPLIPILGCSSSYWMYFLFLVEIFNSKF